MSTILLIGWGALGLGVLIALIGLFLDDVLEAIGLDTLSIGCFATVLGGGILLFQQWVDNSVSVILFSLIIALALTIFVHFYIKPVKKVESSMTTSLDTMIGVKGKVILEISPNGIGEVLLYTGFGVTNRPAMSVANETLYQNDVISVVEIKDNVFYVKKSNDHSNIEN